jgi:hypothetical protein
VALILVDRCRPPRVEGGREQSRLVGGEEDRESGDGSTERAGVAEQVEIFHSARRRESRTETGLLVYWAVGCKAF